ncbi:MAG: hypothetical protein JWP34_4935 [Massilia sp.]|jgi:hypothetical protein|nr:hypothetical protein [Massilia sp.]
MHSKMTQAYIQTSIAAPELPEYASTLTGWVKMPLPMVRFRMSPTTDHDPSSCLLVGAKWTR